MVLLTTKEEGGQRDSRYLSCSRSVVPIPLPYYNPRNHLCHGAMHGVPKPSQDELYVMIICLASYSG